MADNMTELEVKCRRCRYFLLSQKSLVNCHGDQLEGRLADWDNSCLGGDVQTLLFVALDCCPTWISKSLIKSGYTQGKVLCPKCQGRLGSFDFVRSVRRCRCGQTTEPPVHLIRDRVDLVDFDLLKQSVLWTVSNRHTTLTRNFASNSSPHPESLKDMQEETGFGGNDSKVNKVNREIGNQGHVGQSCVSQSRLESASSLGWGLHHGNLGGADCCSRDDQRNDNQGVEGQGHLNSQGSLNQELTQIDYESPGLICSDLNFNRLVGEGQVRSEDICGMQFNQGLAGEVQMQDDDVCDLRWLFAEKPFRDSATDAAPAFPHNLDGCEGGVGQTREERGAEKSAAAISDEYEYGYDYKYEYRHTHNISCPCAGGNRRDGESIGEGPQAGRPLPASSGKLSENLSTCAAADGEGQVSTPGVVENSLKECSCEAEGVLVRPGMEACESLTDNHNARMEDERLSTGSRTEASGTNADSEGQRATEVSDFFTPNRFSDLEGQHLYPGSADALPPGKKGRGSKSQRHKRRREGGEMTPQQLRQAVSDREQRQALGIVKKARRSELRAQRREDEARGLEEEEVAWNHQCAICLEVLWNPYNVSPCQHIFCECCLRRLTSIGSPVRTDCPLCRQRIAKCYRNTDLEKEVGTLYPFHLRVRQRTEKRLNQQTRKLRLPGLPFPSNYLSQLHRAPQLRRPNKWEIGLLIFIIFKILAVVVLAYIGTGMCQVVLQFAAAIFDGVTEVVTGERLWSKFMATESRITSVSCVFVLYLLCARVLPLYRNRT